MVQVILLLFLLLLLVAPFAALAGLMAIGSGALIYRLVLLLVAIGLGGDRSAKPSSDAESYRRS
ncbi:MAG: hypothetical protein MUF72_11560 [Elainella sp. Prado103]|nr:hypothetical protein [Elainella sp. Prado103]